MVVGDCVGRINGIAVGEAVTGKFGVSPALGEGLSESEGDDDPESGLIVGCASTVANTRACTVASISNADVVETPQAVAAVTKIVTNIYAFFMAGVPLNYAAFLARGGFSVSTGFPNVVDSGFVDNVGLWELSY